jgi:hypothetical protein
VHVVGEQRRAGGGVGAGDSPVVGAGAAAVAESCADGESWILRGVLSCAEGEGWIARGVEPCAEVGVDGEELLWGGSCLESCTESSADGES